MILDNKSDVMTRYSGKSSVPDEIRLSSLKPNKEETVYVTEDESEFARKIQNDISYYKRLRLEPGFARQEFNAYNITHTNL